MHTRAPHLVGRHAEMARLADAVAAARAGRGSAVFLVGEAGIGKTRLVAEAVARAYAAGVVVLRGRASAMGTAAPWRPFAEALAGLSRRGALPGPEVLGGYAPLLDQVLAGAEGPAPLGSRSSLGVAEAVLRVLAHLGTGAGCLLALEDLQDADEESLAVLDYLVDNIGSSGVAVVATLRAAPSPALDLVRAAGQRGAVDQVDLRALDRPTMTDFTAACLDCAVDAVPDDAQALVWGYSAGNPLVAEELLYALVDGAQLVPAPPGWLLVGDVVHDPPPELMRGIALRATRLGREGLDVLLTAALLGDRFPLPVVQRATGLDSRTVLSHIRGAVSAQLLVGDDRPDWYAFHHPLITTVLAAEASGAQRREISTRLADSLAAEYPGLPEEWCPVAAALRETGGDPQAAALLRAEAGRRALRAGSGRAAVTELSHALRLLQDAGADAEVAAVAQQLVRALTDAGDYERAFALVGELETGPARPDDTALAALHLHLAYTAHMVGRGTEANARLAAAELRLGPTRAAAAHAAIDAVRAAIVLDSDRPDRVGEAEGLARRALAELGADRAGDAGPAAAECADPEAACRAWYVLGRITRNRDLAESAACFGQVSVLGERHQLPAWHLSGLTGTAGTAWLDTGDATALEVAGQLARRHGAVPAALGIDANLILHAVLTARHDDAERQLTKTLAETTRTRLDRLVPYLLMARTVSHAHRGDRAGFAAALEQFRGHGGEAAAEYPLVIGLGEVVLALLEGDRSRAWRELRRLERSEEDGPGTFYLSGWHGLRLLLAAVDRRLPGEVITAAAGRAPARMRWNHQFSALALAIGHGRLGEPEQARRAEAAAEAAAACYPLGHHLGRLLVAADAAADGWGDAEQWLRDAEAHFHDAGISAAAAACRGVLRSIGASVRQRRHGSDAVPAELREFGVTVREFEVGALVAEHLRNKQIANRLSISPRTVEKHIASLVDKIGVAGREELIQLVAGLTPQVRAD